MELTQDLIAASLQYNVSNSQQLLLRKKNIISIANNFCLEEILLLDLSDNRIETIHNLFEQFPSAWWIYLSNNKIKSLELKNLPNAIGTLNLRNNQLESMESLKELSNMYIMRLYIDEFKDGKEIINSSVLAYLPNLWVLNDDFITSKEIESVSKSSADTFTLPGIKPKNNNKFQSGNFYYGSANPHEKQSTFIVMVNDIPKNPSLVDAYKLDILLDDYLYEACVHNVKCPPKMRIPFFDISKILLLPHRMRLDLSVMLTAEILIFIPRDLLIECLAQLLQPSNISRSEIVSLLQLPGYTKTAIINIIRRIAKKELDELSQNKIIVSKEKFISVDEYIKPDHDGYRFVKSIHAYLRSDIPTIVVKAADISRSHEYSEMELEFLSKLPDVITRSTCPSKEDAGYNSWVSLAARHTVVLLTRVPSCPSLLKSHKTKKEQDLYCLMLPLLDAAAMTHRDLRIAMTGEEIDGRSQLPSSDHHKMPSNIRDTKSLLELRKMNTGAVIPYGAGMPKGSAEKLSWNTKEVRRNYYKPWQSEESESLSSGSRSKLVSHVPTVVLEPESIYSSLLKIKQESVKEEPIQDSELTTLNGEEYEEEEHERTKITEEDFNKLCLIEESKTKSFGSLELTNLMKSSTQQLEPWKNYNWREIEVC